MIDVTAPTRWYAVGAVVRVAHLDPGCLRWTAVVRPTGRLGPDLLVPIGQQPAPDNAESCPPGATPENIRGQEWGTHRFHCRRAQVLRAAARGSVTSGWRDTFQS